MLACCLPLILTLQDGRAVRQALAFVIRCYFFSFATLYYSGLRGGNLCVSWIAFDAKISDYHELSNSTDSEAWEGHILPLIMWTIERGMVKQSGSKQSNFFWTHVFLVCILRFAPNQPPLKYWCPIKISNRNRFPCLRPLRYRRTMLFFSAVLMLHLTNDHVQTISFCWILPLFLCSLGLLCSWKAWFWRSFLSLLP